MHPVVRLRGVTLGYPGNVLFRHLSMDICAGTSLAVLGANGSGKSTFVKLLLNLLTPLYGQVSWPNGKPSSIGYLAQMTEFDRRFPLRVRDLAAMGAWRELGFGGTLKGAHQARVEAALDATGVLDIADQPIHTLSGGQLQRSLFARVIVQDAPLILLDEPFSAVDQSTEAHLLSITSRWRREGRAVVLVVHDLSSVLDHCTDALLLGNGAASFGPVDETITPTRLIEHGYLSDSQASWLFRGPQRFSGVAHV